MIVPMLSQMSQGQKAYERGYPGGQAHIDNLRKKLSPIAEKIQTVPAQGYRVSLP